MLNETPQSVSRREFFSRILVLGAAGAAAVSSLTETQTSVVTQKPVEAPQAAPAAPVADRMGPSPFERRLILPLTEPTTNQEYIQAQLNTWKHRMAEQGVEVQMTTMGGSRFRLVKGVYIRETPVLSSSEDNRLEKQALTPGYRGFYDTSVDIIDPNNRLTNSWLLVYFNPKTRVCEINPYPPTTVLGAVAFQFNTEVLAEDININRAPVQEVIWK